MKLTGIVFGFVLLPSILWAGDFQIAIERKRTDLAVGKPVGAGDVSGGSGEYHYDVSVSNSSFKAAPALTARYIIFVQRQQLGAKVGSEVVEKVKGSADLQALTPHGNTSFSTKNLTLTERSLGPDTFFIGGGRTKAKDTITGVWVKVFNGPTEVAEYVNPTSVNKKNKWEE